jgi:cathepsin D
MQGFYSFPCSTDLQITLSFGGKAWPISADDMNLGRLSTGSSQCLGGIFDLSMGSSIQSGGGNPSWVVGATFLKNVYSVYRANGDSSGSVGFAELSDAAGGSSGAPGTGKTGTKNAASKMGQTGVASLILGFIAVYISITLS